MAPLKYETVISQRAIGCPPKVLKRCQQLKRERLKGSIGYRINFPSAISRKSGFGIRRADKLHALQLDARASPVLAGAFQQHSVCFSLRQQERTVGNQFGRTQSSQVTFIIELYRTKNRVRHKGWKIRIRVSQANPQYIVSECFGAEALVVSCLLLRLTRPRPPFRVGLGPWDVVSGGVRWRPNYICQQFCVW